MLKVNICFPLGKKICASNSSHLNEKLNSGFGPKGRQKMTIINESGLYALVFGSRLKIAKEFKHWVTSEVLPSIRKNGAYIRNQENMTPAEIVARGLIAAQKIIEERLDHSTQPLFILTYSH